MKSAGGVHVIQTFLSAQEAEEIQIKGRTCRQGGNGSYKLILLADDLVKWQESNGVVSAGAAACDAPSPLMTVAELKAAPAASLYAELRKRRNKWFAANSEERSEDVKRAFRKHEDSQKFQLMLVNQPERPREMIAFLESLKVFSVSSGSFHVVFCLDQSGSMSGKKWKDLAQAVTAFLNMRMHSGGSADRVSIVQFSSVAHVTAENMPLQEALALKLVFGGGGTSFKPALQRAQEVFNRVGTGSPLLLFMSDGCNGDGDVSANVKAVAQSVPGLSCHTVFFGAKHAGAIARLTAMADVLGDRGHFHHSVNGIELQQTFTLIAKQEASRIR